MAAPRWAGSTARESHQAVLTIFDLSEAVFGLNQLPCDPRKLKGPDCSNAMAPATPAASPSRALRSHCYSCSFMSAQAGRSTTAASIIVEIPTTASKRLSPR
jgi:hypothetical protein